MRIYFLQKYFTYKVYEMAEDLYIVFNFDHRAIQTPNVSHVSYECHEKQSDLQGYHVQQQQIFKNSDTY
jgi:hypothetical protein